jgi:hypothetical protein
VAAPLVDEPLGLPDQSPLFHAQHAARYDRQALIEAYQDDFAARLVVMVDWILPASVTLFEELIFDADPKEDLHLMLYTPGGDGETAVRLVRSAQARCSRLVVVVPDQVKSAGTLIAIGAHEILMGPTGDLGPVDPQLQLGDGAFAPAKSIIAAVEEASRIVQEQPDTYPIHAALLGQVTALNVQQAREALARTDDLLRLALEANPERKQSDVAVLFESLKDQLVEAARSHESLFGAKEAKAAGLDVTEADARSRQWEMLWRLWAKYFALESRVYEGKRSSQIGPWPQLDQP